MMILEKEVMITLGGVNVKHFEKKGYSIPRIKDRRGIYRIPKGTEILVKVEDLPKGSNVKLTKICDVPYCGKPIMNQTYDKITSLRERGDGKDYCIECGKKKAGITKLNSVLYEKSLEFYAVKNNKEYLIKEFSFKNKKSPSHISYGTRIKVLWKCSTCNNEYLMEVNNRTSGEHGCPICAESKGEKRIRQWLIKNNTDFEPQKEFDELLGLSGYNLSFDFYLKKYNILIEFQGQFHDGSSGEYSRLNLERQQEHDYRKREYAKKNNINLLEIWYWDYDNIEDILNTNLVV